MRRAGPPSLLLLTVPAVALALPVVGRADDGEREGDVRIERTCTAQSTVRLRVRGRDGGELRVELDVRTRRREARWAVVTVHERRLVSETTRRTGASSGSFSLRFTIPDWPGRDTVTVRATGPRGEVCRATASVAGD